MRGSLVVELALFAWLGGACTNDFDRFEPRAGLVGASVGAGGAGGATSGSGGGCTAPEVACEGSCVDVASDAQNCGRCKNACTHGGTCTAGVCVCGSATCAPMEKCGSVDGCTCPAEGVPCAGTQICCSDGCRDPHTDPANCGGCGISCAAGQVCTAGVCG